MRNLSSLALIATTTLLAAPSASLAGDSALVRGLIGGILQTMQQAQQQQQQEPQPAYNGGRRQFRVEDDDAERLYFRQEIQKRLNMLGYSAGYPDGRFGSQTRSAIAAFQDGLGHRPTGKITENEIATLYDKTNDPTIAKTPQKSENVIQPTIVPQQQETSPETAPISLAPVATLEPTSQAPTAANTNSGIPKATVDGSDTPISIQPSITLPSSN